MITLRRDSRFSIPYTYPGLLGPWLFVASTVCAIPTSTSTTYLPDLGEIRSAQARHHLMHEICMVQYYRTPPVTFGHPETLPDQNSGKSSRDAPASKQPRRRTSKSISKSISISPSLRLTTQYYEQYNLCHVISSVASTVPSTST
ncbi:hypothetical protein BO99DRAFT_400173 [Aspergillus violaceofuscus CBS 115571]|uniref:Uncharacterized protein n=1 Tax=Aspergillus violaceofuscus (strain CBS 115571) TaxID=1450538 RepID=A0A2V5HDC6_ASPV1|nr:hypothetical protein BO99DRAFT_400173 [Aspergillus violaceofuscus CBS 115571]